jgi:hypothetical protein
MRNGRDRWICFVSSFVYLVNCLFVYYAFRRRSVISVLLFQFYFRLAYPLEIASILKILFHSSPKFLQALSNIGDNAQLLGGDDGAAIIEKYVRKPWKRVFILFDFFLCINLVSVGFDTYQLGLLPKRQ